MELIDILTMTFLYLPYALIGAIMVYADKAGTITYEEDNE